MIAVKEFTFMQDSLVTNRFALASLENKDANIDRVI